MMATEDDSIAEAEDLAVSMADRLQGEAPGSPATWQAAVSLLLCPGEHCGTPEALLDRVEIPVVVRSLVVRTPTGVTVLSRTGDGSFSKQPPVHSRLGASQIKLVRAAAAATTIAPEGTIEIEDDGSDVLVKIHNPTASDFGSLTIEYWVSDDDYDYHGVLPLEPSMKVRGAIEARMLGASPMALVIVICDVPM